MLMILVDRWNFAKKKKNWAGKKEDGNVFVPCK
jgi:hypothetical protein